ncbi:MAG: hypothetical protein IJY01_05395 [Clostridia bacterium]|nr:hypothetical protein [Clostridia bacterium]
MMKKCLILFLALTVALSALFMLCACETGDTPDKDKTDAPEQGASPTPDESEDGDTEADTPSTPEGTPSTPEGTPSAPEGTPSTPTDTPDTPTDTPDTPTDTPDAGGEGSTENGGTEGSEGGGGNMPSDTPLVDDKPSRLN